MRVWRVLYSRPVRTDTVKSIPSLPWQEVPDFYSTLEEATVTHLALRLLILTGLRSRPIRFLRLNEIDGDVWTVPAENMKARLGAAQNFRVPLYPRARSSIPIPPPDLDGLCRARNLDIWQGDLGAQQGWQWPL